MRTGLGSGNSLAPKRAEVPLVGINANALRITLPDKIKSSEQKTTSRVIRTPFHSDSKCADERARLRAGVTLLNLAGSLLGIAQNARGDV